MKRPSSRVLRGWALFRLLRYVRPHAKYACLTVVFGVSGFLLSFVYPWIIGSVVDLAAVAGPRGLSYAAQRARLIELTEFAAITALLHAMVVYGRGHFNVHLGDAIVSDLRRQLFEHLQKLGMGFYGKERTGTILSRVLHDVHASTSVIYGGIIVSVMDAAQLLIASVLLLGISWKLTFACIGVLPLYGVVFAHMNPRVRDASERLQAHLGRISGNVTERIAGQAVVKAYTAENREARHFAAEVGHHHELVVAQSHAGHLVSAYGEVLVHVGTTVVIGYGGFLTLSGELTPGMLMRFLGYLVILYGPVRRLAELNITYQTSLSAMRRVFRVFEIPPSIVDASFATREPPRLGQVVFEDVWFRFGESEESRVRLENDELAPRAGSNGGAEARPWVLSGVTLSAAAGTRVAVVGPSGAGKTTLLSLLPRLFEATRGRVLVDDRDVRAYTIEALRSAIGIVQQDTFVFSGTVLDNIRYGRPAATVEEIVEAARAAHAEEFIRRLPAGYETLLGERGINLSGGQRQRISIARALLKGPKILILDEATSSLDAETESIVHAALETLMEGRTCFIIAHRLSTIRNANNIVVLEHGRLAEWGDHAALIAASGTYARLVQRQGGL